MALPSQTRSTGPRRYTSTRSNSRMWLWLVLALCAVAATAYFFYPNHDGSPAELAAETETIQLPQGGPEPDIDETQVVATSATEGPRSEISNLKSEISNLTSPAPTAETPTTPPVVETPPVEGAPAETPAPPTDNQKSKIQNPKSELPPSAAAGLRLLDDNKPIEGRAALSDLLINHAEQLTPEQAGEIRQRLAAVNEQLIFSKGVDERDPLVSSYVVQSGDRLTTIARQYKIPYEFIARVNGINPDVIRVGQRLKVVKGPFHAVVDKSEYRMDIFLDDAGKKIYIRSFKVGLGEDNSTPTGNWVVRNGSKLTDPGWVNPRTSVAYAHDDPANPIGERWIGLRGSDEANRDITGYGVHGTIDPDSIGKQMSMGCVRLGTDDIALVFDMLTEVDSTIRIQP